MNSILRLTILGISIVYFFSAEFLTAKALITDKDLKEPIGLFLTWQQDPTSTMSIDWHTKDESYLTILKYREVDSERWETTTGEQLAFPYSDRIINRVELKNLNSDSKYEFRFGENNQSFFFRTMPEILARPLRIAIGGVTMHHQKWFEQTNRQVLKYDPDFVVIGGDMSYADASPPEGQHIRGDPKTMDIAEDARPRIEKGDNLWYHWFDAYKNTLITEENRVIPMLVTIGNHEVQSGYYFRHDDYKQTDEFRKNIAPYFYTLFAMPGQPGYNVLDFGDYMSLILLDSGHSNPPYGKQKQWLKNVLTERLDIPHVFPVYHIATYPSVRDFDAYRITSVREAWVPLFEQYGVRLAFENHDHAYKRTHPIRDVNISNNGIVYIGDGSWGTVPREVGSSWGSGDVSIEVDDSNDGSASGDYWYIKKAKSVMHFIILTIDGPHQHLLMVDNEGNIIDEYPNTPNTK